MCKLQSRPWRAWHQQRAAAARAAPRPTHRACRTSAAQGGEIEAQRLQQHQALLARILQLPAEQLPKFVDEERERLTFGFLSYLSERARGGGEGAARRGAALSWGSGGSGGGSGAASSQERARLSELASRLVALKEAADWESAQRALPPLASSLAYSNYAAWREGHPGEELADVAPGVSLEDLYRAGEREELKLQRGSALRPKEGSGLDDFARRGPGAAFSSQAAGAMERVRLRLMGYQDDGARAGAALGGAAATTSPSSTSSEASSSSGTGSADDGGPAAQRVLRALLLECECRGERAQALAEACVPPGLSVAAESAGGPRISICSSPPRLLAAVAAERQRLQRETEGVDDGTVASGVPAMLPSGEAAAVVLAEVEEDVREYEVHVWSRLSPLERYGAAPGSLR